jgi:glycosyltransferase involved in cell wall biosynthesis
VGSLEQMYKSPDVVLEALAIAARRGAKLHLTWIGEGKHRQEMEGLAARYGIDGDVRFVGHLPPGRAIRDELDAADLFVLASRTEGLPRALVEAMARGLPCVGSDTGGIVELLSPAERVPVGAAPALADKILEVLGNPDRLARLSRENLSKAHDFHASALRPQRASFYRAVRDATLRWQGRTQS